MALDAGGRTVLRPSWVSTCSIPVAVAMVLVSLSLIADGGLESGVVVFIVVFAGLFVPLDRRRSLELGPLLAVRRGQPWGTSIARVDVRSVNSGPWWRGGITLAGPDRSLWAPVGDRPFGYVSTTRLGVVQAWAASTPDHDGERDPTAGR